MDTTRTEMRILDELSAYTFINCKLFATALQSYDLSFGLWI